MTPIIPSFEVEEPEEQETRHLFCPDCSGTGWEWSDVWFHLFDNCERCNGKGEITVDQDGNEVKK